jgi:phosphoenolpyruvate synthase/pyruvate phosphate dikinase
LRRLEQEFHDVQEVEFTIENGRLWILQTRSAKRTPLAALRIAIDLVHEGLRVEHYIDNRPGIASRGIARKRDAGPRGKTAIAKYHGLHRHRGALQGFKFLQAPIGLGAHELDQGLKQGIDFLERATGRRFGDRRRPLLVSVRSGAARSMPGMMDTVLDVGASSTAIAGLVRMTGDPRFAWDCRRRFIESYATLVRGIDPGRFATALAKVVADERVASDSDLDGEAMERASDQPLRQNQRRR